MILLKAMVAKYGLAKSAVGVLVALLVAWALGTLAWANVKSVWFQNKAERAEVRAERAEATAVTAQGNANSANAGAVNATTTRQAMDAAVTDARVATQASATRIENYAHRDAPIADIRDPVDPDILRELDEADRRARAAADRLQRESPS